MKYYAYYPRDFANEYDLISCDGREDEQELRAWYDAHSGEESSLDRVTVRQMRSMIASEKFQRKHDESFAYFAPVAPVRWSEYKREIEAA